MRLYETILIILVLVCTITTVAIFVNCSPKEPLADCLGLPINGETNVTETQIYSDEWILEHCDSSLTSDKGVIGLSPCINVSIEILHDFVMENCKGRTESWNDCWLDFSINGTTVSNVWITDGSCLWRTDQCVDSEYCELWLHSWSNGASSLYWQDTPINYSAKLSAEYSGYITLLNVTTYGDYLTYRNNRGMYFVKILNCEN